MENKKAAGMTRRGAIKTMGLAGAALAGALSGCAPKSDQEQEGEGAAIAWDGEADIVIVGAGGTGLAAAAEAGAAGAKVVVIEKASAAGGCTSLSGAVMQAAGTDHQKRFTEFQDDTPEKHFEFYKFAGEGTVDEDLIKDLAYAAPGHVAWMESLGVEYDTVYGACHIPGIPEDLQAYRIHSPKAGGGIGMGAVHVSALMAACEAAGVEFVYETEAKSLVKDETGRVVGVSAEAKGKTVSYKGAKGVLLATAGIDQNPEMAKMLNRQHYYDLTENACYCPAYNTGDGIRMGMEAGAAVTGFGGTISTMINGVGGGSNTLGGPQLLINGAGQRFVCEDATYAYPCRAIFQQEKQLGKPVHLVFGKSALEDPFSQWSDPSILEGALGGEAGGSANSFGTGSLRKVETIEELAEGMGVDLENLAESFDKWNADIEKYGEDRAFGRANGLSKIEPPYFFQKATTMNLGSVGGLKINVDAQVVDVNGEPIPGLYAGGMCTGGWIGEYYPGSGTAIVGTVHWGRKAAQSMLAQQ